jgi:N-acetylmuramic acid 6-phosphate (MurNAc-6-P) etherase
MSATNTDYCTADRALKQAQGDIKTAIVMLTRKITRREAQRRLKQSRQNLRVALAE